MKGINMRWLITVLKSADLSKIEKTIRECGGELNNEKPPVPLGDSELVIQVKGPVSLPDQISGDADIIGIFPDSDMELY